MFKSTNIHFFLHCNDAWSKYSLKFFADLYLLCIDSVFKLIDVGRILQVYSSIPFKITPVRQFGMATTYFDN